MKILPFEGKVIVTNKILIQRVIFLTNFSHHEKGKLAVLKYTASGLNCVQEIQ